MIIVERPGPNVDDEQLLHELGFASFASLGTETLEGAVESRNAFIGIGRCNGHLIITEGHKLTEKLERTKDPAALLPYEQTLSRLFPGSEVLSVACHSTSNYAMHSLVKDGVKLRYRRIDCDGKALVHGAPLAEEEPIYARSQMIGGVRMFRGEEPGGAYEYTEDQLMEDFTFEVAKRHLGVRLDRDEADAVNDVELHIYRHDPRRKLIPKGMRTWDGELATYWMEDGVLVALLNNAERTVSTVTGSIALVKEITGGRRVPVLMLGGGRVESTREAERLSNEQSPLVYSAMAWIRGGWISRWTVNRSFKRTPDALPRRVFGTKEEALAWLRKAR
ncbi:MAG: hypothetical protein JNL52_06275 [Flavobacteriales bacterium]|nr:hypothetical protein [Flavobacteriales bacterium]